MKNTEYKKTFTQLQVDIIEQWKLTTVKHPSYGFIAKRLNCSTDTVFRTVKKFIELSNSDDNERKEKPKRSLRKVS